MVFLASTDIMNRVVEEAKTEKSITSLCAQATTYDGWWYSTRMSIANMGSASGTGNLLFVMMMTYYWILIVLT